MNYPIQRGYSTNPKLTMEFLEKPWDCDEISGHPNLTMEFVEKHSDKQWNWNAISKNMFAHRFTDLVAERLFYLQN
jgi:hypothetical protein